MKITILIASVNSEVHVHVRTCTLQAPNTPFVKYIWHARPQLHVHIVANKTPRFVYFTILNVALYSTSLQFSILHAEKSGRPS